MKRQRQLQDEMRNIEALGFGASNIRDLMVLHFLHVSLGTIDLKKALSLMIIKSPRYTGGDFMFLCRFVRRRRRPQILVHAITFE